MSNTITRSRGHGKKVSGKREDPRALCASSRYIMRFWEGIGGRKFLCLCLAAYIYLDKGTFDFNLALVFAAYMGMNVLNKFVEARKAGAGSEPPAGEPE